MTGVREAVRTERQALIDLLELLAPEQWVTPSLCAGWTVQDVAAHLAWAPVLPLSTALRELVRVRFRPNRLMAETATRWSERGPAAIVEQLRRDAAEDAKPVGMPWDAALLDAVVHGLDIRRPLDVAHALPPETFRRVADFATAARWPTSAVLGGPASRRIAGLRLVAADQEWSTGSGQEVRASADTILLLLTGRRVRPAELSGAGAETLRARLNPT